MKPTILWACPPQRKGINKYNTSAVLLKHKYIQSHTIQFKGKFLTIDLPFGDNLCKKWTAPERKPFTSWNWGGSHGTQCYYSLNGKIVKFYVESFNMEQCFNFIVIL